MVFFKYEIDQRYNISKVGNFKKEISTHVGANYTISELKKNEFPGKCRRLKTSQETN